MSDSPKVAHRKLEEILLLKHLNMKKTRFTETQIISILNQQEAGLSVRDLAREHGISEATYYNWKAKYGGMETHEIRRMKE